MKKVLFILVYFSLFVVFVTTPLKAEEISMTDAQSLGSSYASQENSSAQEGVKSPDLSLIPEYTETLPNELQSLNSTNLAESAQKMAQEDPVAVHIQEAQANRPKFTIKPESDPMFERADKATQNPEELLADGEVITEEEDVTQEYEDVTCHEGGDEVIHACFITRSATVKKPSLKVHRTSVTFVTHNWGGGLSVNLITGEKLDYSSTETSSSIISNPFPKEMINKVKKVELAPEFSNAGCSYSFNERMNFIVDYFRSLVTLGENGVLSLNTEDSYFEGNDFDDLVLSVDITYQPAPLICDVTQSENSTCDKLEEKTEAGLCFYEDEVVTQDAEARTINDYPLYLDWWQKKRSYRCHYPIKDTCMELRAKDCSQGSSICAQKIEDTCVAWQQTYQCPKGNKQASPLKITGKGVPYCLDGNCTKHDYAPNTEMAEALSKLALLRELQGALDEESLQVFKGTTNKCRRNPLNFKDCCGSGKGWGLSLKFSECSSDEKRLVQQRQKNLCVYIGTYCSKKEKITNICLSKKTSYCCFPSKIARIIQEQGRPQLGLDWGSPKEPACQGLTVEQICQLDFSKIDLKELLDELLSKTKIPNATKLGETLKENVDQMSETIKKNPKLAQVQSNVH